MAKKNSWLNLFKRLFTSEAKPEKKEKRRKWIFGRLKIKRLASITAPSEQREKTVGEAEEEQSKRALTVAIASAAAAEAAVAAAQAAAEVVRLTGISLSTHQSEIKTEEHSATKTDADAPRLNHYFEDQIQEFAVTKIQTAFRGYLARKALRALKGIVKLQAIIRGQTVRRQARTTLKCLQSIVNIQSQACASRIHTEGAWHSDESRNLPTLRDKIIKVDTNSQRRWDRSTLTKEEADAIILSKREAVMKRERIKEYSYNHRKSAESEQNKGNGRWKYWLEQWVDTQLTKSKEMEDLDLSSDRKLKEELGGKQLRLRSFPREYHIEELGSPLVVPRRSSHHRKQCSLGDDNSFSTSPVVPTYMAATESAKAKSRSFSSPKLRPASFDTQSESYSPYKNKVCLITSTASEAPSSGRINRPSAYQQRSPGLRGLQGPIKSNRMLKDLSINSECSLPNWNRESAFR